MESIEPIDPTESPLLSLDASVESTVQRWMEEESSQDEVGHLQAIQEAARLVKSNVEIALQDFYCVGEEDAGKRDRSESEQRSVNGGDWVELAWRPRKKRDDPGAQCLLRKAIHWMVYGSRKAGGPDVFSNTGGKRGSRMIALISGRWSEERGLMECCSIQWRRLHACGTERKVVQEIHITARHVQYNTQVLAQIDLGWEKAAYAIVLQFLRKESDGLIGRHDLWKASLETNGGFSVEEWILEQGQPMF